MYCTRLNFRSTWIWPCACAVHRIATASASQRLISGARIAQLIRDGSGGGYLRVPPKIPQRDFAPVSVVALGAGAGALSAAPTDCPFRRATAATNNSSQELRMVSAGARTY